MDPEQPRLTLRLPPVVLVVPLLALAAFGVVRTAPWEPRTPEPRVERAAAASARADEPADRASDSPSANAPSALEPTAPDHPAVEALGDTAPDSEPVPPPLEPTMLRNAQAHAEAERRETAQLELARARDQVEVVVYYAQWCGYCTKARAYLAQRGIRSVEHDVDSDTSASGRHRRLNPRGSVPTIDIDGQVLVGFSERSIERALERAARARLSRERGS